MILQYLFLADDPPLIKYKTQLFRNVDVMVFFHLYTVHLAKETYDIFMFFDFSDRSFLYFLIFECSREDGN